MDAAQFESISMVVGIGALISLMAWIVYDLAKRSNAGKFGMFVLYFALGLGVVGFLIKTIIVEILEL